MQRREAVSSRSPNQDEAYCVRSTCSLPPNNKYSKYQNGKNEKTATKPKAAKSAAPGKSESCAPMTPKSTIATRTMQNAETTHRTLRIIPAMRLLWTVLMRSARVRYHPGNIAYVQQRAVASNTPGIVELCILMSATIKPTIATTLRVDEITQTTFAKRDLSMLRGNRRNVVLLRDMGFSIAIAAAHFLRF